MERGLGQANMAGRGEGRRNLRDVGTLTCHHSLVPRTFPVIIASSPGHSENEKECGIFSHVSDV